MSKSIFVFVVCAACAVPACGGQVTRSGDTSNGDNMGFETLGVPAGPSCAVTEVELDPSSVTPLGFSAQAVLDLVVGEHTSSLEWLDGGIEYGPEDGRSEITLTIAATGAPRLIDRELAQASESPANDFDRYRGSPLCRDALRIPATVTITTSSGALHEVAEATFEAYEGDFAHGGLGIELGAIGGTFRAGPAIPEGSALTASALVLELGFTPFGISGAFRVSSSFESADAIGAGTSGEIAHFPADDYCGPTAISVGAEQTVRGLSASQALASLNGPGSTTVSYDSAETSELDLDFSSLAERVCARFDTSVYGNWPPGLMTLDFPGAVQLTSTDGLIGGEIPVLIATTNQNDTGMILATASADIETTRDAGSVAALPGQLGIKDTIDVSEYDGVAVEFSSTVWSSTNALSGLLEVRGVDIADCVKNPPPRDPDATRIAPCAGIQRRTVWSARWDSAKD